MDWLSKQEIAQTFRKPLRRTGVRAIVATKLGQFQADLLDMSSQPWRGFVACFSMIDIFSKKLYVKPLRNKTAISAKNALRDIMRENPNLKITSITNDNGGEFSNEFATYLQEQGIKQHLIAPHQPWSNGIIERSMATVRKQLSMWMKTQATKDWVSALPNLVDRINNTMSFATKKSPNQIEADLDTQNVAGDFIKRRAAKGVNVRGATTLKEGDLVRKVKNYQQGTLKKPSKTGYFSKQKYQVVRVVPSPYANQLPSYKIQAIGAQAPLKGLVARWQLLLIPPEGNVPTRRRPVEQVVENDEEEGRDNVQDEEEAQPRRSRRLQGNEYELEYIVDKRYNKSTKRYEYLIHWTDNSETWEPKSNLTGAQQALREFEQARRR